MTTEIIWTLSANALAEYTAEDGTTFQHVIETVHWRCAAKDADTGEAVTLYGSQGIPKPTDMDSFIDLSVLQGMSDADKRSTIVGWIEAVEPGFGADKEQAVADKLAAKLAEPKRNTVSIL